MMTPLIDADILRYEIGACGEYVDEDGVQQVREFAFVESLLLQRISEISALVWATEPPIFFLTMDARTKKRHNKRTEKVVKKIEGVLASTECEEEKALLTEELNQLTDSMVYKPNFREAIAEQKAYKGTRKNPKPHHYDNLTEYLIANFDVVMAEGLEADDLLSVYQWKELQEHDMVPTTIICSRDKDLRITPGMHFGWECGRQAQYGPEFVKPFGQLTALRDNKGSIKKCNGTGISFFAYQLLIGDTTDNIPGCPKIGPAKAYAALEGCETEEQLLLTVKDMYVKAYGDEWSVHMLEQAQLLWMVRELDEDGQPVMYELPKYLFNASQADEGGAL